MDWTEDQKKAIYEKNNNILVAAAAGSGKTAVLVERIIQKILNDGIDIDRLLVVTFTNAAASEMRERVLEAIYKKLEEDPNNENLQRQIVLLGKSNICTMHSFCLNVIRNNFFEIDIPATFRIGSEQEVMLLKAETLEDLFESLYENNDEGFEKLVNTYTDYKSDDSLKELVLKIYNYIQSMPFPKEWLKDNIAKFDKDSSNNDFAQSMWGKVIINNIKSEVRSGINTLRSVRNKLEVIYELEEYKAVIEEDINTLKGLYDVLGKSWDEAVEYIRLIDYTRWPSSKVDMELKDEVKKIRSSVIDRFKNKGKSVIKDLFAYDSKEIYEDFYAMHEILDLLGNLIFKFDEVFSKNKKEKNILDFNDIEHFALKILGNPEIAKKYKEKFVEIAIDEYQDSNHVQDYIIGLISRGNNIFMVGDVKQSIYKFRQACPKLFLEKYNNYSLEGNEKGKKIKLFKNFRSKENVLDITNLVFENIMTASLGDNLEYTEEEYLNLGANFEKLDNGLDNAEIDIIDLSGNDDKVLDDDDLKEVSEYENEDEESINEDIVLPGVINKTEIEAKFVAKRIKEIISSKVIINDKKGPREVKYKDIVILLRSTKNAAAIFEKELINNDIPVFSDGSNEYLDTIEIQTIINILKMLDNPLDDIALVSAMRSVIGDFGDNEILEVRLLNRECSFYESLKLASEKLSGEIKEKVEEFLNRIVKWREESDYISLAQLVWKIYNETGFYNYVGLMPNGSLRQANLKMLFEVAKDYEKTSFAGIYNFIKYVERLKTENSDMSAAKIIGENEDVVRIMSIHKSKGLEFPIVILSDTAKQMNFRDLNSKLILHQDLGFGPDYINYETMQEYPIIAKEAIKIVSKEETIAEEMRILYVALTRAKEKLIITGIVKNYEDRIQKMKDVLLLNDSPLKNDGKISPLLLKKYITYLDWLELVYLKNSDYIKNKDIVKINKINLSFLEEKGQVKGDEEKRTFEFEKYNDFDELEKRFNWKYGWIDATEMPIKTTVSKIKNQEILRENESYFENIELNFSEIPSFMKEKDLEEKITGAHRGTLIHNMLERIDFKTDNSIETINELKKKMLDSEMISKDEFAAIDSRKILNFINSSLGKKISSSTHIEKEKPFCINIEIGPEKVLVQGVIDLYAIMYNGEIILVDYKTDYVNDERELIEKYQKQLELYKYALEKNYNKRVSEVYIYSIYLDKEIKI